jgi:hypothetical protein
MVAFWIEVYPERLGQYQQAANRIFGYHQRDGTPFEINFNDLPPMPLPKAIRMPQNKR